MSSHHTQKGPYSQHIFPFWKTCGETLAVMLGRFCAELGIAPEEKLTYAGRLDPMAEGVVLVLAGEGRFHKDALLGLEKTYEVTVLLGAGTDTADMLGLVTATKERVPDEESVAQAVRALAAVTELPYPMYSSRPVDGRPLFVHARAGNAVEVPVKQVSIKTVALTSVEQVSLKACVEATAPVIERVAGDFRQGEIIEAWRGCPDMPVTLVSIEVTASSGTYMRSLAEAMGQSLGMPALAYRIRRTAVGGYKK